MALEAAIELGNCIGFDESSDLYKKYFLKEKSPAEENEERILELLFNEFDVSLFHKSGEASFKNILGNKTFGYLEGYGYYVLTHKLIGKTKYAILHKYKDKIELFDTEVNNYLYNRFRIEEEKLRGNDRFNYHIQDLGIDYFKEYYIYSRMLESYVKYYDGNVPSDIIDRLLDRLNNAFEYYNPEIANRFTYDAETNSLSIFNKNVKLN